MYYRNKCRKDCLHYENGKCKFGYNVQNSIFHVEQKKCIYYSAYIPKQETNHLFDQTM